MKKLISWSLYAVVALFLTVLVLPGCDGGGDSPKAVTADPGGTNPNGTNPAPSEAETRVTEANTALSNQDIATAKAKFQAAVTADPNNKDANFGFAMTEVIMLIEDPDVVSIMNRWEANAPTVKEAVYGAMKKAPSASAKALAAPSSSVSPDPLAKAKALLDKLPKNKPTILQRATRVMSFAPATAPSVSEMQAVLDNKVIPAITDAITKLRMVEGAGFTFTITPAMTGGKETVNTVLDDGEFYAADAALSAVKAILSILTAYNLDLDYNIAEYDPLSVLNNSTQFFTLRADGTTKMAAAQSSLQEAVEKAKLGYDFVYDQWGYAGAGILSPTKAPGDNGIQFHEDGCPSCFTTEDDANLRKAYDAAKMALAGQVTLTHKIENGTATDTLSDGTKTVTLDSWQTSESNHTDSWSIDATKFFTAPLDRTDLPTLAYDMPINGTLALQYNEPVNSVVNGQPVRCNVETTSDFPDKTFNGILLNGIPGLDASLYFDKAVLLDSATWSGWNASLATDGTYIYLYKQVYTGSSSGSIWKINPANGAVIATYPLNLQSSANGISWINSMAWYKDALWASGGYGTVSGYSEDGVFKINLSASTASNQIPTPEGCDISGLASDGATNLYAGIRQWSGPRGVVKFTDAATSIPTSPYVYAASDSWIEVGYGGGYLWVADEGIKKINPSNGSIVKTYEGEWDAAGLYFNDRLWSINDDRLSSYVAP